MESLESAVVAGLGEGAGGSLEAWHLAVWGWRLKLREQFDELLCLSRLRSVRRLDHQVETVLKVLRSFRGRALLADEVGLGKTIEAGMLVLEYVLRGLAQRILILTPAALVGQWQAELEEKFDLPCATTEEPGFRAEPEAAWASASGVVVASLQLARSGRHAPLVQAQAWDLVVVDEAHHVKRRASAGFRLVDSLRSRYLLLLTATPVENDLEELYNLVTLLKPGQLATLAAFKRDYVSRGDPLAPRNRERLRALLGEVMIRNTRALAGRSISLPPRFAQTVVVEPSPEEAALYAAVVAQVRTGAEGGSRLLLRNLLEQAGSCAEAVLDTARRDAKREGAPGTIARSLLPLLERAAKAPSRKVRRLLELLRALPHLAGGSKAVVFTRFRATLDRLVLALDEAGIAHAVFTGGMTGPEKAESVRRFQEEVPVLLATGVGGEGCNLQFANVLVNFDLPWNPMSIEQRIGRLHRIGQTREVHVFSLCNKGSAEERILDVLDRRIHLFELVVGELDLILGRALDEQEFEERIFEIYARAPDEATVAQGFDTLARELAEARGQYEKVKALDEALLGRDYET